MSVSLSQQHDLARCGLLYHENRFHQARQIFTNINSEQKSWFEKPKSMLSKKRSRTPTSTEYCSEDDEIEENDEHPKPSKTNFSDVSLASTMADEALCRFRSAISSNRYQKGTSRDFLQEDSPDDTSDLLERALEANRSYRTVLEGVVSSLRQDAFLRYSLTRNDEKCNVTLYYAVSKHRMQTALAVLMAGVTAAWLYLHHHPVHDEVRERDEFNALLVMQQTICLAESCFWLPHDDHDGMNGHRSITSWEEGFETIKNILLPHTTMDTYTYKYDNNRRAKKSSSKISYDRNEMVRFSVEESQRIKFVLQTVENSLCVIHLSSLDNRDKENGSTGRKDEFIMRYCNSDTTVGNYKNELQDGVQKYPAICETKISAKNTLSISTEEHEQKVNLGNDDPKLFVQRNIGKALWHHANFMRAPNNATKGMRVTSETLTPDFLPQINHNEGHKYQSNEYLKRALAVDSSGLSEQIKLLLEGVELLLPPCYLHSHKSSNAPDSGRKRRRIETLCGLEKMLTSSRSAAEIVGCLHAQDGCFEKALTLFQKSLDSYEKNNCNGRLHDTTDQVTISNIAQIFAMLGKPSTAVELLLHLLTSRQEYHPEGDTVVPSLLNLASHTTEHNLEHVSCQLTRTKERCLLWRLFHLASLCDDWDLSFNVSKKLDYYGEGKCRNLDMNSFLATIFSLLQGKRLAECKKICLEYDDLNHNPSKKPYDIISHIAIYLYTADMEVEIDGGRLFGSSEDNVPEHDISKAITTIIDLTKRACDNIEKLQLPSLPSQDIREIMACLWNNYGVSLAFGGEVEKAMSYFLEACKIISPLIKKHGTEISAEKSLSLHCFFNLTLLLLQEGFIKEAKAFWLKFRGFRSEQLERATERVESNQYQMEGISRQTYVQPWGKSGVRNETFGCIPLVNYLTLDEVLLQFDS